MLVIIISVIVLFILELIAGSVPVHLLTRKKTLYIKIRHSNGLNETKKITLNKNAENKTYKIMENCTSCLQLENRKVFICNPYKRMLIPHTNYALENGAKIRVMSRKPRFLFTITTMIGILTVFTVGKLYIREELIPAYQSAVYPVTLTHDFEEYIDKDLYDGIHNYLIVGTDVREGMLTPHADVMLLISFNENTRKMNICSILRDTYVQMQDKSAYVADDLDPSLPNYGYLVKNAAKSQFFRAKLNYAVNLQYLPDGEHTPQQHYAEGLNSLVNTIENTFKIYIDGVINFSWSEFMKAVDKVGGVEVEITDEMLITEFAEERTYGIMPVLDHQNSLYCLDDTFEPEAGIQHLNGNMALAYVRLRYVVGGTNSDVERAARIRGFFISLLRQKNVELLQLMDTKSVTELFSGVYSSLTEEELDTLLHLAISLYSPSDQSTLPYQYHNLTIGNIQYIAVDGKNDLRLDAQAQNKIVN